MKNTFLAAACAAALAVCGQGAVNAPATATPLPVSTAQCAKDTDCKGNRICEGGRCTDPAITAGAVPNGSAAATAAPGTPAVDPALEEALTAALRLKPGTTERMGDSGEAIRRYIEGGYVAKTPDTRADYSDYRLLKRPAPFMGHELVALEEEYMQEYVGCCVSPGVAATVRLRPGGADLDAFAKANGCSVGRDTDESGFVGQLVELGLPEAPKGTYATLACKERDIHMPE